MIFMCFGLSYYRTGPADTQVLDLKSIRPDDAFAPPRPPIFAGGEGVVISNGLPQL
jgi:hypothetical protein